MDFLPSQMTPGSRIDFLPSVPGAAPSREEQLIRRRLATAEHFLRHQRPAQALALLQAPGAPPLAWPLRWHPCWCLLVGWALLQQNQPQLARGIFKQGLKTLKRLLRSCGASRRAGLREWREWLHYFLGVSWYIDDQPLQALFHHRLALQAITDGIVRDPELGMLIHKGLGDVYLSLGASDEAMRFFRRAKQYGHDVSAPDTEGLLARSMGLAGQTHGDFRGASLAFSRALRIFEQLEAKLLVSQLQSLLGQVQIWLRHYEAAETLLRQALGAAERLGDPLSRAMALLSLAALHLARGKSDKAIRAARDGLALLEETKDHRITGQLYLTLAHAFETRRDLAAAEEALLSAITTLQQTQQYGLIVRAHECYGTFLADQGRFQEAYEQLRTALHKTPQSLVLGVLHKR